MVIKTAQKSLVIVTDLDETLLRSDKAISDYTVEILNKCRAKGIKLVFATARSAQAAAAYLKRFKPDIFIGYGGALISEAGVIIKRFDMPHEVCAELINESLNTPDVQYIYAVNETVAFTNNTKRTAKAEDAHYKYANFKDSLDYSYLKISLTATNPSAVEKIASHFPMLDMLRYSGEDLYRFANRNAVKWNAVKAVAEYYKIHTDSFVAFGDDYNDLEMLQKCGTGVAMKNAIGDVKAVSDYICGTNNDDGVAKWIEKQML